MLVRFALGLALAAGLAQGENLRLVRGQVSEVKGTDLTIRDTFLRPVHCQLPDTAEKLAPNGNKPGPDLVVGSTIEAIVDQTSESCTIRTVYVRPPRPPLTLTTPKTAAMLDNLFPRGNLVYTGTVQGLTENHLQLRERRGARHEFIVRSDTTFSTGGRIVERDELLPQTVVQVRAGKNFAGELEVYQITWGDILPAN